MIKKQEYLKYVKKSEPSSPSLKNCTWAFFTGGIICLLGELLHTAFVLLGFCSADASLLVSSSLIALSGVLTALGIYRKIAAKAGAGTLVPITGFANAIVAPAIEFKCEGFITGVGAKIFVIAGPVILYGVLASVLYGVIYFFVGGAP